MGHPPFSNKHNIISWLWIYHYVIYPILSISWLNCVLPHVFRFTSIYTYIHIHIRYIHIHTYIYIYIHSHVYVHIHTYINIYIYIYLFIDKSINLWYRPLQTHVPGLHGSGSLDQVHAFQPLWLSTGSTNGYSYKIAIFQGNKQQKLGT
jgi:hypothetical protein